MNTVVLDASALLALLNREPGAEMLTDAVLSIAVCSAVNLAEVHGKLIMQGMSEDDAWKAALYPLGKSIEFTTEHAQATGNLIAQTRALGLSLGDRACLALGVKLRAPVYTADRSWKKLLLPISIHVIR
jgi:PIN domain nuclease of toxin-antitoxin system